MKSVVGKTPKACEPCRRRKLRCSGKVPCCQRCRNPIECVYRLKPRERGRSKTTSQSAGGNEFISNVSFDHKETPPHSPYPDVYHSVAASNYTPQSVHSSQLFYGPSSNFAFLQQIHRNILAGSHGPRSASDVQEGGPGLDMFMQRSIFFGTPSNDIISSKDSIERSSTAVSITEANLFLEQFRITCLPILGLPSATAIENSFLSVYGDIPDPSPTPSRALIFAILAVGALSTPRTDQAELLYHMAKQEAIPYDEDVSLPMIQLSILLSHYQLNIGRPNAAYLHVGTACRKAFALGLHHGLVSAPCEDEGKDRCHTLWFLYFCEVWLGLMLGRKNMMRRSDLTSCPAHGDQPVLVALFRLAVISEEAIDLVYTQRAASLRDLHVTVEQLYAKLYAWGKEYDLGNEATESQKNRLLNPVASFILHGVYFHTVLLAFRPFLIAESALSVQGIQHLSGQLWLRQACRRATDTAQDALCFLDNLLQQSEECRKVRFGGFFFETWCGVLFYDSLRHPAKHAFNMEYVQMALKCLNLMFNEPPVTTAIQSILRIQQAVEQSITASDTAMPMQDKDNSGTTVLGPIERSMPNIQFPSLDRNVNGSATDLIVFTDKNSTFDPNHHSDGMEIASGADLSIDPLWISNYDVLTTDLFNFFPTFTT